MDTDRKQQVEQENAARIEAEANRKAALVATDYSQYPEFDKFYDGLSVADLKFLDVESSSFRERVKQLDSEAAEKAAKKLIVDFRGLPENQQKAFYDKLLPYQKAIIDADYDRFNALTSEEQAAEVGGEIPQTSPAAKTPEEIAAEEAAAAAQAEADRLAAEAAAQVQPVVVDTEDLYDGIEKLGPGSYKLTVDPGDGTPVEVFYGPTQKDCFKKLRKSKASATKELRRRAKEVQITDELRGLDADIANYPFVKPVPLTPDETFLLTEDRKKYRKQLNDPTEIIRATAKLREIDHKLYLASLTPEECKRINGETELRVANEQSLVARKWIESTTDFYNCDLNIQAMKKLMGGLNWAVTIRNLDLAHQILIDQGVLLDRPEEDESSQAPPQPASVVPVVVAPVVSPVPPAPVSTTVAAPAASTGGLPAPAKVLRPGSSSTATMPTRRIDSVSTAPPSVVLTVEEYHKMPAGTLKYRYDREPAFKAAVDKLIADGKV